MKKSEVGDYLDQVVQKYNQNPSLSVIALSSFRVASVHKVYRLHPHRSPEMQAYFRHLVVLF
jgi:hypothetical protein